MAEYQARTGYDPSTGTGTDPADTIESQWIRKLERDLWARFWGPGVACANYDSGTEYERCTGWDQSGTIALSMGDVTGNPFDHHTTQGTCSAGGHTNQDTCEAAGETWTGVTSNDPRGTLRKIITGATSLFDVNATAIVSGTEYTIKTPGNTSWDTEFGAANNNAGTTFIASTNGSVDVDVIATAIVLGTEYIIKTLGLTDWTTVGAPANSAVGTKFTADANGSPHTTPGTATAGSGTGVATNANSCEVTCVGHALVSAFNYIQITGVPDTSMFELNEQYFYAKIIDVDTLELYTDSSLVNGYDASGNHAWLGTEGWVNFVVDRDPEAAGREPNTASDMTNHELTSTVALQQHLAILRRINESILRTAHSTGGQGGACVQLPEVTRWGALRGSSTTLETGLADDLSRVRDDHVNQMSAEIESIGSPLDSTSMGTYNFNKIHTVGIHGNSNADVYNQLNEEVGGAWIHNWGNDYDANSGAGAGTPWSWTTGTNWGKERPFAEARYRFTDWEDFRYFFNQGGEVRINPIYNSDDSYGGNHWENLCAGEVYIGQHTSYAEDLGHGTNFVQGGYALSDSVTADAPRAHAIADQPNHYLTGTFSGSQTITYPGTGATMELTGFSSTTGIAAGDILHFSDWFGEVRDITSTKISFRQFPRLLDGTVYGSGGPGVGTTWSCSKWYRACHYDGYTGLYGESVPAPHTPPASANTIGDGYILFDWRLDFLDGPMDLFVRCMYANTLHISIHGGGQIWFGRREPKSIAYFEANHPLVSITKDNASTSETINSRYRA